MRTLVVLCAGNRRINELPIFLNRHPDGKLLAEKAIEGIYPNSYDQIIYSTSKSINDEFGANNILEKEIGKKYNVLFFEQEYQTNGPAESVYLTLKGLKIEGEFVVRDSLNKIILDNNETGNFVAGLNLITYDEDVYNLRTKSFIVTNEQKQILDVIEKRLKSDIISVGLYGFKNVSDFFLAYENLNDRNYPIGKMYISNIISYLIGYKQRVFHCADVSFHEDWGTAETWSKVQKKYATVFVDIDGLMKKIYKNEYEDKLVSLLTVFSNKNQFVILFTRNKEINKKSMYQKLKLKKINCIDIISSVSFSSENFIVSDDNDLQRVLIGT